MSVTIMKVDPSAHFKFPWSFFQVATKKMEAAHMFATITKVVPSAHFKFPWSFFQVVAKIMEVVHMFATITKVVPSAHAQMIKFYSPMLRLVTVSSLLYIIHFCRSLRPIILKFGPFFVDVNKFSVFFLEVSTRGSQVTLNPFEHDWSPCNLTCREGWGFKTPRCCRGLSTF